MIFKVLPLAFLVATYVAASSVVDSFAQQFRQIPNPRAWARNNLARADPQQLKQAAAAHKSLKTQRNEVSAAANSDYAAFYLFSGSSCDGDSVLTAAVYELFCMNMNVDGVSFSTTMTCSDTEGFGMATYYGSNCNGELLNSTIIISADEMNSCVASDDDDDDDDNSYDDDAFSVATYTMFECSNEVKYGLEDGYAIGYYSGSDCDGTRVMVQYINPSDCVAMGNDSISSSCDADFLTTTGYEGSADCSSSSVIESGFETNKCMEESMFDDDDDADDDDDDDDFYYDDDVIELFTMSSSYAACKASDLPSSAFTQVISGWAVLIAALAGLAVVNRA